MKHTGLACKSTKSLFNSLIVVFTIMLVSPNLLSQPSCYKRTLKEVEENLIFNADEIDSICNNQIVWSKKHDYFGYEIHHNLYDDTGRITQKIMWNFLRVELSFRPAEDFPQYKSYHTEKYILTRIDTLNYNYIYVGNSMRELKFLDQEKERIVFEVLTNRIYPMEVSQANFYYEYKEDTLLIKKEEYDLNGQPRTEADSIWNKKLVRYRKPNRNLETSYIVRSINHNTLAIHSESIPLKPSINTGSYFHKGINCKVLLDEKNRMKEIDHYWLGKTVFLYQNEKLSSLAYYRSNKIYKQKVVE